MNANNSVMKPRRKSVLECSREELETVIELLQEAAEVRHDL